MASGITRPVARSLKGRMFSAVAAHAESAAAAEQDREPKCSVKKLSNGMLVGTIETQSPVARLAVFANAGARFESGENLGITHMLRRLPQLRTENISSLGITRSSLQLGSDIIGESTRQYLIYRSNVTRNCAGKIVEILRELTTKTDFKPWEVRDLQSNHDSLKLDLAILKSQPFVCLQELLHEAAFRDTLGRSLYAPEHMVGKYNPDQLSHYVKTYFCANRLALVGVGIDHLELEAMGAQFEPYEPSDVRTAPAQYNGGELRSNTGGELAYAAVALGGPSLTSKDLLPAEILRHILGVRPVIKYSTVMTTAKLAKATAQVTDSSFYVGGLNANYTDSGLIGFSVVAPSSVIEKVLHAATSQMQTLLSKGVTDADVTRAKTQLKAEICMQFENPDVLLGWLGEQTLHSDQVITPQEVYKMVDPITTADVNNVAKTISGTRPSMASVGNTTNVPYLDQLLSN